MYPTDETLVAAYVERGDESAFGKLVDRHQERIFGYLMGMVRNREVANDLFQETFFRVISALSKERGSYTRQGKFLGWVLRIARNAALDHLRSNRKWQDVAGDGEDESSYWDNLPSSEPAPDSMLFDEEQADFLAGCIDRLSPHQRDVLLLRHESELTFREIADLMDCSINTALGRMRYALLNMRRMIDTPTHKDLTSIDH